MMQLTAIEAVARGGKDSTLNIPVKVEGYDFSQADRPVVVGERLDTGDQVRVFLRPDRGAANREFARPEIKDFAAGPRLSKVLTPT